VWSTINTHKDLINMKEQSNEIQWLWLCSWAFVEDFKYL
jgi:hypothetical protein